MKIVSFVTLGCRLNQAEEEKFRREFSAAGFFISDIKIADLIIVNTCSVTQLADKKSRQKIRSVKKENPKAKIIVIGCGVEEARNIEGVDLFIKNKDKQDTFKIIKTKHNFNSTALNRIRAVPEERSKRTRALLKIQDGCNNFCTYCIVPYLRGREVSISISNVISEAKKLDQMGYKELIISGVNVGQYYSSLRGEKDPSLSHCEPKAWQSLTRDRFRNLDRHAFARDDIKIDLIGLIRKILENTDFPRIRLSSVNPQDIADEMIELGGTEARLCEHFHLSLQSGSNSVLMRMKRPYDAKKYREIVDKIRKVMPSAAITTDVIVGFPGETEKEFEETCDFIKSIKFVKLHVFPYSIRKGTKAAEMPNQIDQKIKKERAKKLREIGDELRIDYQNQFIGKELKVLFEKAEDQKGPTFLGKKVGPFQKMVKEKVWYGLTENYIRIKYKTKKDLENQILRVKIGKSNLSIS